MSSWHLNALYLFVGDVQQAAAFYREVLAAQVQGDDLLWPDGFRWHLCSPRPICRARGPHGVVPVLEVDDLVQAKAWIRSHARPIVFEEVVPGLARLIFLDPDGNPVELVQSLAVDEWQRGARLPEFEGTPIPPRVVGMFEVSVYARDVPASVRFYRDVLGLETGLAYFAHIHLLFDNLPLVIRPTWRQCDQPAPHTPALSLTPGGEDTPQLRWEHTTVCGRSFEGVFDGEHTWVLMEPTASP